MAKTPPLSLFTFSVVVAGYMFDVSWIGILSSYVGLYAIVYLLYPLLVNIRAAQASNVPYLIIPWTPMNAVWVVFSLQFHRQLAHYLPALLWGRLKYTVYGWPIRYYFEPFERYAAPQGHPKSLMYVHLGDNNFWTWDPNVVAQILNRPNDFAVTSLARTAVSAFGENAVTASGEVWARHRKVIASAINERLSRAIFDETVQQTRGLVDELFKGSPDTAPQCAESNRLFDAMAQITINVLSGVMMGKSVAWDGEKQEIPAEGYRYTFIQALKIILHTMSSRLLLPSWVSEYWPSFLPGHDEAQEHAVARREYPKHVQRMLDQERQRQSSARDEDKAKPYFVSTLVQAADGQGPDPKGNNTTMSNSDMIGNMFIFSAGGFETTASTLGFSLVLLARHPEWQEWLFEEIDALLPAESEATAAPDYAHVHPRARRTLCFMLETLRLYPSIITIVKCTTAPQTLQQAPSSHATYHIPAGCTVFCNLTSLHRDPDTWRNLNIHTERGEHPAADDEWQFRPSRWMDVDTGTVFQPPRGAYMPWSMGPRVCPGMKMAQIEFVTATAILLQRHRVEAVALPGEGPQDVKRRLSDKLEASFVAMTLTMPDVYRPQTEEQGLKLRVVRRR